MQVASFVEKAGYAVEIVVDEDGALTSVYQTALDPNPAAGQMQRHSYALLVGITLCLVLATAWDFREIWIAFLG